MSNARLRIQLNEFLYAGLFLIISVHFALNFSKTGKYFLDINKFIDGQAAIPYQYRILTAPIFKGLIGLFASFDLTKILQNCPLYIATPTQQAYFIVNTTSYFVSLGVFALIAREVFDSRRDVICTSALFVVISYAIFILNPNLQFILPYDMPSLAFVQICCLLVLQRRWAVLGVVFALATLNRETSFLIILFVLTRVWTASEDRRTGLAVAVILSVIWLAIKFTLSSLIVGVESDAPVGGIVTIKFFYNLTTLLKPWQWPSLSALIIPVILTICFLFEKPNNKALDWIVPYVLGFTMIFIVANVTEHRAFGDLIGFAAMSLMFFFKSRNIFSSTRWFQNQSKDVVKL
jgi:hypothetical protein